MKTLFVEPIGGVAGDMLIGAFLDLGMDWKYLKRSLNRIPVRGYVINRAFQERGHIRAVKFDVRVDVKKNFSLRQIKKIIKDSAFSTRVTRMILSVYDALALAETKVHGHEHRDIQFDQLGDIDSIVDIAGFCLCFEKMGFDEMLYPVMGLSRKLAPATLELLEDRRVYCTDTCYENITPTGMAILRALGSQVLEKDGLNFEMGRKGYGAGSMDPESASNVTCLFEAQRMRRGFGSDEVVQLEANIDDMNPQFYEILFERLYQSGALEVFLENVLMKKTRPGFLLKVLSRPEDLGKMAEVIFYNTSTLGVRYQKFQRLMLDRDVKQVRLNGRAVRVKVARGPGGLTKINPEYDDVLKLAKDTGEDISSVYQKIKEKALIKWHSQA